MPQISIISTVFNGEQYLEEYFFGIENQTFTDFELILVDDGSTDNSGLICEEHAKKDSRIQVYHQANQGLAAARNNAFDHTAAEWITFIDCDDVVHPQYLEILYRGVENKGVYISGAGVLETEIIPSEYDVMTQIVWEIETVNDTFLTGNLCNSYFGHIACGKLISRQIIKNHPFTLGRYFEDNALVPKWIYDSKVIAFYDGILYYYRINPTGISKSTTNIKEKIRDMLWARDEVIEYYKAKGLTKAYSQAEKTYILFGVNLYFRMIKIDQSCAKKIKALILKRYRADKNKIDFSKENKKFIFELKHPFIMWLYWKICSKYIFAKKHVIDGEGKAR